jgi:hypothetical protein
VVESLLSKHEALSSNPTTAKRKQTTHPHTLYRIFEKYNVKTNGLLMKRLLTPTPALRSTKGTSKYEPGFT